jgi:ubiquinone biosynthesis protein UbiJ
MLDQLGIATLNHLLRDADWARERLRAFTDKAVRCEVGPLRATLCVSSDGTLLPGGAEVVPDATIRLAPPAAVRLAVLKDDSVRADIEVEGDAALAEALLRILRELRWDAEEDLSRVIGDIAAHRLVSVGRGALQWHLEVARSLTRSMGEYITEEREFVAPRDAVAAFVQAVDQLREATDRLDKRIGRLMRKRSLD